MAGTFITDTQHRCRHSSTGVRVGALVFGDRGWMMKAESVWRVAGLAPSPGAVLVTNTCCKPGFGFGVSTRVTANKENDFSCSLFMVCVKSQDCSQRERALRESCRASRETFPVLCEVTKDESVLTLTVSCTLRSRKLFVCLKKSHVQFITGELCLNSCVDKCVFFALKKLWVVNISWTTAESHTAVWV